MSILYGLNSIKLKNNDTFNNEVPLLTLNEYKNIAIKCIAKYATSSLAKSMLRSEDAISYMIERLIIANCAYRTDGGCVNLHTYFSIISKYTIKRWVNLTKTQKNKRYNQSLSIDMMFNAKDNKVNHTNDDDGTKQIADYLNTLPLLHKEYLQLKFVNHMNCARIAKQYNVSRQSVHQIISKALKHLKEVIS